MNYGSVKKIQKINTPPVNLLFRFFQTKAVVEIWFYDNKESRFEGKIIGFDEYMNLTLDDAYDINTKSQQRQSLGRILLKGENITLIRNVGHMEL